MKYICLVYLVEKDMSAMTKKEADTCIEESLAYDDDLRKARPFPRGSRPAAGRGGDYHPGAER